MKPDDLLWTTQCWLSLLRKLERIRSMRVPYGLQLSPLGQRLQSKLADRLQHHEPRLAILLLRLPQQVLVQEGGHRVQHCGLLLRHVLGHCLNCLKGAATYKDGESTEEALFVRGEQGITPLDRLAQGLLPGGHIPCAADEQRQALP